MGWADTGTAPQVPDTVQVLRVEDIGLDKLDAMSGRYYDFELVAATRPWFARYLLSAYASAEYLVFMAPAARLYSRPEAILETPAAFYLTPHITERLPPSGFLDDKRILNIGMFHSGAWMARPEPAVLRLLEWWSARTADRAYFDLCNGMCLDQLWLNYVPTFVPDTQIVRHEGWHVGLHNSLQRRLLITTDGIRSGESPLVSIDFTGCSSYHPVWSDHTGVVGNNPVWKQLQEEYLLEAGRPQQDGPAGYGKPAVISPNRGVRKRAVKQLHKLVHFVKNTDI